MRSPTPPAASTSWNTLVGRRYIAADAALSWATLMLALCVLSMLSKATNWPAVSTTATAIGKFILRASAMAPAKA